MIRRVRLELTFVAELPEDDLEGDKAADRIGDEVVSAVEVNLPDGVFAGSVAVVDWTDSDEEDAA